VVLVILIRIGYGYQWTGFGQAKVNEEIEPAKSLGDWLELLIIPAVIAGGGIWLNRRQQARDQQNAEQRAQDDALQAYLDNMT
jgi:hypothetical protein